MRRLPYTLLVFLLIKHSIFSQSIVTDEWPGMVGYWTFDNSSNITEATIGNDLELFGDQITVPGPSDEDGATRIGTSGYYKCTHDILPNGGGTNVNKYSLLIDFKIPELDHYYCFYQTSGDNSDDGEIFVNPSGHVGISETGYSYCLLRPGQWYRLVIAVDLGNTFRYYIDGNLVHNGISQAIDERFSLEPFFYFFRDDNNEDNEFDVSSAAIFNYTLSDSEVESLGGYGHYFPNPVESDEFNPYLQSPTPNSIYISWHADDTSTTLVKYGTTGSLENQSNGSVESISGKKWHTVKLEGLIPDTEYYYKCISGSGESEIANFRTLKETNSNDGFVRFIILGDSRTEAYQTQLIATFAEEQIKNTYGNDWHNEINLVINVGDIVETDAIDRYTEEYFNPYANLSKRIPFMVSVGNHEYNVSNAENYYKYMKYEELTGDPFELPSEYNEKFYSFQIANCLFIGLNSNVSLRVTEQLNWLENILDEAETNDEIDFVFPFSHHPGHSELWPDGNTDFVQNEYYNLFKNYSKLAIYSYGHSHDYERGVLELDSDNENYINDMHLLLSGGAGSHLDRWGMYDNQQDYPEIHLTLDHYNYTIVEVNIAEKSWEAKTYSMGNSDLYLENELVDHWYNHTSIPKPETPIALRIENQGGENPTLVASEYIGDDAIMTSQFQITDTSGDYSNPILNVKRDWQNIFGDSGSPDYTPINLNENIVLNELNISGVLSDYQNYNWRVRYRDFNLKWSEWSEESDINILGTPKHNSIISQFRISPNPIDNLLKIQLNLLEDEYVTIQIFDTSNRCIKTLINNKKIESGKHSISWEDTAKLSSGIYYCKAIFSGNSDSIPFIVR